MPDRPSAVLTAGVAPPGSGPSPAAVPAQSTTSAAAPAPGAPAATAAPAASPAPKAPQAGRSGRWIPEQLELKADQLSYDGQLERFVARGNATVLAAGGRLIADRLEIDPDSQVIYASGSVRLQRGQQYLQASRLRFHLIEANGEAEDVYGILDLEDGKRDFNLEESPSTPLPQPGPISCPPALPTAPQRELWPLSMVGLGRANLPPPAMPPAQGCPGAPEPESQRLTELPRLLEDVAMGPVRSDPALAEPPSTASTAPPSRQEARLQQQRRQAAIASIDQRVDNVRFRQSLTLEQRFGGQQGISTSDAANQFGQARPAQLQTIATTENRGLVRGSISRWRFQARRLRLSATQFSGDRIAFTNDPFTPAQAWMDSENVVATLRPNGDTVISSSRNRMVLDDRLAIPVGRRSARLKARDDIDNRWVLASDTRDRSGVYLGYNIGPIGIGDSLKLEVQPQLMVQRALSGTVDSYPLPGQSAGSPGAAQPVQTGDLFGLVASLKGPWAGFNHDLNLDVSTLNSANLSNGTRSWGTINRWLGLPLVGNTLLRFFGAYRYRSWNGSLGEQDVYSAYGASLEQTGIFKPWGKLTSNYYWRLGSGNFQANQFQSTNLQQVWRTTFFGSINGSLPLWTGQPLAAKPLAGMLNTPAPVVPGLALNANLNTLLAGYSDGSSQNTVTLSAGPTLTLGHLSRPWFDYTQLTITGGVTLRQGASPLAFDRAVDLGTINFGISQQLVGPLLFVGGVGYNVDPNSQYYGQVTGSYMELRWQRRAYEVGVYYSPYEQLGGIRVRLNDMTFDGPGVPFVPYAPNTRMPTLAEQGPGRRPF